MNSKNHSGLIVFAIGFVVFVAAITIVFRGPGQNSSVLQSQSAADDHHSGGGQQGDYTNLNDLIDKPMPSFSLSDMEGNSFTNENLRGKKVVFFFSEGLMCYPACWDQIVSLAQDQRLNNDATKVISVVVDKKEDWQNAINKMPELGAATVVSDTGGQLSSQLGILNLPSSMHRGQLPGHTYFVMDQNGTVRYAYDDPNMAINNDVIALEIAKL